ncbi:4'-phosphopantetheinyl transferase superfamily protein [Lysinibacillus sp. M3]|uniref:4'-phosphopantetheinyl transferase superfamily protein n=1 Tax=Lysinibacillus zambalensis TaxID=3160866 RepID=A0ABV1MUS8_9BACI
MKKKEQLNKFFYKEDKYRSILSDVLVRYICLKELKIRISELEFEKNLYGKPYLKNNSDFHFNISHSGKWIVCAVGSTSLGVDIEEIKEIDLGITKFFSEWENNYIHDGNDIEKWERFFDIWTLKESYIKAVGKGMSINLDSFTIMYDGIIPRLISSVSEQEKYYFKQYNISIAYKLSVCSLSNKFPREIEYIDTSQIFMYLKNVEG